MDFNFHFVVAFISAQLVNAASALNWKRIFCSRLIRVT